MSKIYDIVLVIGSLRKDSYNRKAAMATASFFPAGMKPRVVEIGSLPFYNEDLDTQTPPAEWTRFREEIAKADGVMFFTPEYNRTAPAALKNAVDVGSRPYGKNVWDGKPAAIVSASIGSIGGFGATHNLRQALVFVNMPCMPQPEAYMSNVQSMMENDKFNGSTMQFLKKIAEAYAAWLKKLTK